MSASGYFTSVGHKGCTPHTPGCTCTDTMKCNQVTHPEWWPKAGECRPDLSSYGSDFYPTTNCSGCAGPDQRFCTYGGPRGRIGSGSAAGCTSCKGDFWHYYAPTNPAYRNFPARHCASTCDCRACANKPISSNCQGRDNTTGAMCDCSFGNMQRGCWDNNCTGGNSTCDCTRCANMPISSRCKGVDSKIPGLACDCGLPDPNVCWNYNCCYQGQSAPGPGGATAPTPVSNRPPKLGRNVNPIISTPSGPGYSTGGGDTTYLLVFAAVGLIGLIMLTGSVFK